MPTLKRIAALALVCTLTLLNIPAAHATAYDDHPKLVIILVLDQFRADYLERYRADFVARGFNLFLDHGAWFPDCYFDYANTETAPGHSTIGTGAYTDGHGIGGNQWWDLTRSKTHPVTSVEDERYALVGVPSGEKTTPGASPRNLLASTVGDELRLNTLGQSEVFGVSLKDRASILPAGATANGAFWIDPPSGRFITSTYYMAELPEWAETFNDNGRIAQAEQEANAPGSKNFYGDVGPTPAAVSYEFDFAKALITGESLGKHATPDLLTLSISSTDMLGHRVGPDAPEQRAMVDAVDTDLADFFDWLDKNVEGGLGNVWIALTADHGIAPLPSVAAQLGLNATGINLKKLADDVNYTINEKFSPGEKVQYLLPDQSLPYLVLNPPSFDRAGINEPEAEDAVQKALPAAFDDIAKQPDGTKPATTPATSKLPPTPKLVRSYTRVEMASGQLPPTPFGELIAHSYSPNGGWYVMLITQAFQMQGTGKSGTNHFTAYSYDRHVPLAFYGAPFAPGTYRGRVEPTAIAATFASLLGVNQPSASIGQILTQALKPSAEVTYPKPPPVRTRHRRSAARHAPAQKTAAHKSTATGKPQ
ncbi:MAG TPA: alkaline phosphatase family protein [Silvibacterium sp.]|nr:alkaline phosphatase family protein [Silvibacterium sp.]